jgi:hypothetical protein
MTTRISYVKVDANTVAQGMEALKQLEAFQQKSTDEEWERFKEICHKDEYWVKYNKGRWTKDAILQRYENIKSDDVNNNKEKLDTKQATIVAQADIWESHQRYCDISNKILKILSDEKLTIDESKGILTQAEQTINDSIGETQWEAPLICQATYNEMDYLLDEEGVREEIYRRKKEREIIHAIYKR